LVPNRTENEDFIEDFKGTIKRIGDYLGEEVKEKQIGLP